MTASYSYNRPSRVSEQARAKVLAAAEQLGYAGPDPSARSLRRGSTRTIGVVLGEHLTYAFEDGGAASFLAGVADVCAARGFGMTILPTTSGTEDADRFMDAAVDGFVVWTTSDDDPTLAAIRSTRRPAVVHGGPTLPDLPLVTIDNRAAARAIGALAFTGARRPAVVSQPLGRARVSSISNGPDIDGVLFQVTRDRLAGYREAAEEAGFAWDDVVVAVCSRNDAVEAETIAGELLGARPPPDAIAAMSDQQAAGVVAAARSLGQAVPGDLAVTGWDDLAIASHLDLTTVAQSLRDQGAACALVALGENQPPPPSWSVVKRGSTREPALGP
jgi:DNA-binding LacI/PurR family transcriptional regulator